MRHQGSKSVSLVQPVTTSPLAWHPHWSRVHSCTRRLAVCSPSAPPSLPPADPAVGICIRGVHRHLQGTQGARPQPSHRAFTHWPLHYQVHPALPPGAPVAPGALTVSRTAVQCLCTSAPCLPSFSALRAVWRVLPALPDRRRGRRRLAAGQRGQGHGRDRMGRGGGDGAVPPAGAQGPGHRLGEWGREWRAGDQGLGQVVWERVRGMKE